MMIMKKYLFASLLLIPLLGFMGFANEPGNKVMVDSKDTKLPDWQWTSGQLEKGKVASKELFTILFDPKIYRPRDSIRITFTSYKVAITNLNPGTTFSKWTGKMNLIYYMNNTWLPIVVDTNDRINQFFSGVNNHAEDSLVNYTVLFAVPINRSLTITTSAVTWRFKDVYNANTIIENKKMGVTLTTSIRGIEVQKIERTY
jgi:hypothetical protein